MLKITKEWAADHKQQQQKRKKKNNSCNMHSDFYVLFMFYVNHQITIQLTSKQLYGLKKITLYLLVILKYIIVYYLIWIKNHPQ